MSKDKKDRLLEAIEAVKHAATAQAANDATRISGCGDFLFETNSKYAKQLNGPLTDIWLAGSEYFDEPSATWPPEYLDRFKDALVERLRIVLTTIAAESQ